MYLKKIFQNFDHSKSYINFLQIFNFQQPVKTLKKIGKKWIAIYAKFKYGGLYRYFNTINTVLKQKRFKKIACFAFTSFKLYRP